MCLKRDFSHTFFHLLVDGNPQELLKSNTSEQLFQFISLLHDIASSSVKWYRIIKQILSGTEGVISYSLSSVFQEKTMRRMWSTLINESKKGCKIQSAK